MEKLRELKDSYPLVIDSLFNIIIPSIVILIIGVMIARHIRRRLRTSSFGGKHVDETLRPVIASFVFYAILASTVYAVLVKLGVPPTSLLAVFGAAGLAVALALKDTLSNIAAGMMLLFLRPLSVGDAVDINSALGTVIEIGLFSTTLKTPEGLYIYVPNGAVWDGRIQNFSRHSARRASINVRVGYEHDLDDIRQTLLNVVLSTQDVLDTPDKGAVYVTSFENTAIHLTCRCWLPGNNWTERLSQLHLEIKRAMDKAGVDMSIAALNINPPKS